MISQEATFMIITSWETIVCIPHEVISWSTIYDNCDVEQQFCLKRINRKFHNSSASKGCCCIFSGVILPSVRTVEMHAMVGSFRRVSAHALRPSSTAGVTRMQRRCATSCSQTGVLVRPHHGMLLCSLVIIFQVDIY